MAKIDLGYLQEVFADRNWRSTSFAVWSENYSDSLFSRARIAEAWSIALAWREEIFRWQVDCFVAKPEILISEKTEAQGGDGPECTAFHIVLSVEAF